MSEVDNLAGLVGRLQSGATASRDVGSHLNKYQALCDEAADALAELVKERDDWRQAAEVEAKLRREFHDDKARLVEDLEWIGKIANANFEQDDKLRSQGARTLKRIADRVDAALSPTDAVGECEQHYLTAEDNKALTAALINSSTLVGEIVPVGEMTAAEMREACAIEAERLSAKPDWSPHYKNAAKQIAKLIRALSTEHKNGDGK